MENHCRDPPSAFPKRCALTDVFAEDKKEEGALRALFCLCLFRTGIGFIVAIGTLAVFDLIVLVARRQKNDSAVEIDRKHVEEDRETFAVLVFPDAAEAGPEFPAAARVRDVISDQLRRVGLTVLVAVFGLVLCHVPFLSCLGWLGTPSKLTGRKSRRFKPDGGERVSPVLRKRRREAEVRGRMGKPRRLPEGVGLNWMRARSS